MATKEIKDWTKHIEGLATMEIEPLTNLYTEMLATAHDIGYTVPDALLVETENPDELRKVIEPLDAGIKTFFAEAKKAAATKKTAARPKEKAPKKQAAPAKQKVTKETNMATATAKKAAAPKAAKKAAKAPAKKAAKKASAANARTAVSRYSGDEVITVKVKENPARKGTGKFDRMANLIKHNGKTVTSFLKSALGKSGTLRNAAAKGYVTIK